MECIFCKIVNKEIPAEIIYEDEFSVAFLDLYPACEGQVLVIPKKHYEYIFTMPDEDYRKLMDSAKKVANILDEKIKPTRTCLVIEGFEVPHVHVKLYPVKKGYLNIKPGEKASEEYLKKFGALLRGENNES